MDRDVLKRHLDDGLSLPQIGGLLGRDPSTVGYWVRKHGLVANGSAKYAPRGGIPRERLEQQIARGATLREMADKFDRSTATVRYWLRRHGLAVSRSVGRRPLVPSATVQAALEAGARTVAARCPRHGQTVFVIENSGRSRCRLCRIERVAEWRRRVKRQLVSEAGGCCQLCGYSACVAALQFHHRDPSKKLFQLSMGRATRSAAELRREAAKCALLCANCHAEVEAGYSTI
jgi:hypothetical protein